MGLALSKLAEEDPTFRTYTDEETGQTIIAGMGELHLDILLIVWNVNSKLKQIGAPRCMLLLPYASPKLPAKSWR